MSLLKIKTTLTILFLTPLEEADWSDSQHDATRVQNRYFCKQEKLVPGFDLVVHLTVLSVCFGFYSRRSCAPVRTHKAAPLLIPGGALALHRRTNTTTTGRGRLEVLTVSAEQLWWSLRGNFWPMFVCVKEGVTLNEFIISILLHQFLVLERVLHSASVVLILRLQRCKSHLLLQYVLHCKVSILHSHFKQWWF